LVYIFHPYAIGPGGTSIVLAPFTVIVNGEPPGNSLIFDIVKTFAADIKVKGLSSETL
jgi:hypothetical protein